MAGFFVKFYKAIILSSIYCAGGLMATISLIALIAINDRGLPSRLSGFELVKAPALTLKVPAGAYYFTRKLWNNFLYIKSYNLFIVLKRGRRMKYDSKTIRKIYLWVYLIVYVYLMWIYPFRFITDALTIQTDNVAYQAIRTTFIGLAVASASIITLTAVVIFKASKKLIKKS